MTDATANAETNENAPAKSSKRTGMILGIILAISGAGGGFYAVNSGLLGRADTSHETKSHKTGDHGSGHGESHANTAEKHGNAGLPDLAFVELDPIIISLHDLQSASHIRFSAQLEVTAQYQADVAHLKPRIVDLMNGYLRALHPSDFEDPLILSRLRSQLLRRVQILAGEGRVNDVLIMEFVLT